MMKLLFENWRRYLAEEEARFEIVDSGDEPDFEDLVPLIETKFTVPPEKVHPKEFKKDKEAWKQAYGPAGANQRAWLNKITRDTGLEGQPAIDYYDRHIMPQVNAALETPLYKAQKGESLGTFSSMGERDPELYKYPKLAAAQQEDPAKFGSDTRRALAKYAGPAGPKDFRTGVIGLSPAGSAVGHERSHALGHTVGEFQPVDLENEPILKKLFPQTDVEKQKLAQPTLTDIVPRDQQMKHYQGRAEQAASVRQLRRDLSLGNPDWKEFTADDIIKLKKQNILEPEPRWWRQPYSGRPAYDIRNAMGRELDPELSDEEAADLLNQIVRNTSDPTNTKKA
jgi:hypothetical protein